jgi:hypothetical protein
VDDKGSTIEDWTARFQWCDVPPPPMHVWPAAAHLQRRPPPSVCDHTTPPTYHPPTTDLPTYHPYHQPTYPPTTTMTSDIGRPRLAG